MTQLLTERMFGEHTDDGVGISLEVTEDEAAAFTRAAELAGIPVTTWCRSVLLRAAARWEATA